MKRVVLEEKDQWEDHEIDGKMSYRVMQPTCSGFGTGRLRQETRSNGGRRLGRPWPEKGPKHHRRRENYDVKCQWNLHSRFSLRPDVTS
jgi:hypothetical protein